METKIGRRICGWTGRFTFEPNVVVQPQSVEEIAAVLTDKDHYPSPVRAVGSNHSVVPCAGPDNGTLVDMTKMDRIIEIGHDYVMAEAGALYIDVAKELERHNLQFFVNTEFGNLTMGAAACAGTKDASMPGEFGQVSSYATAIKMVTPSGEVTNVTEVAPELLRATRSSYGLLGIVYEVRFRVKPLEHVAVEHRNYSLDNFVRLFPDLVRRRESIMLYLYPFLNSVTVEFLKYNKNARSPNRLVWKIRNFFFRTGVGGVARLVTRFVPFKPIRYFLIDMFNRSMQLGFRWIIRSSQTMPADQIVRYPEKAGIGKYTFSLWAFPEEIYPDVLQEYFDFCQEYDRTHGYRCNMMTVGYRIGQDTSNVFSYSAKCSVVTIDPVSTGDPGWDDFLVAFNHFSIQRGGVPLFNQTPGLTPEQAKKSLGDRLDTFRDYQKQFDPTSRLANSYFKQFLQ